MTWSEIRLHEERGDTFVECINDLNSMIDGSFGFEMVRSPFHTFA